MTGGDNRVIAEGKTKIVRSYRHGEVLIESKDDITAGDGARRDILEGKAAHATTTTVNCFELLNAHGLPTHYIGEVDERTFRAQMVQMIPLELVARRIATGSYLKRRPDAVEGTVFDHLVLEFFEKDDASHDPLVVIDLVGQRLLRYKASLSLGEGFMGEEALRESRFRLLSSHHILYLADLLEEAFTSLEQAWAKQDVALVDLKIECGWEHGSDRIVIADVIDNDSWRIWPRGDKARMVDKQVYRELAESLDPSSKAKELGRIKDNYAWVAEATSRF